MAGFNLADYQTVQDRIEIFWSLYQNGRIFNDIVVTNEHEVIIKCSVWKESNNQLPDATDFAQEPITEKGINSVSAVENCSTSATGRALSLLGGELSPSKKRASQSEMAKMKRVETDKIVRWAKEAYEKNDLNTLRECYSEAKEANLTPEVVADILRMGSEVSQKVNAPSGKENETEGAQA